MAVGWRFHLTAALLLPLAACSSTVETRYVDVEAAAGSAGTGGAAAQPTEPRPLLPPFPLSLGSTAAHVLAAVGPTMYYVTADADFQHERIDSVTR